MGQPKVDSNRKTERVNVKLPVFISRKSPPSPPVEGEITNLSEGGAFVICKTAIPAGTEVFLEIRFAEVKELEGKVVKVDETTEPTELTLKESLRVGVIRWNNENASGFGVQFVESNDDQRSYIKRVMSYFLQLKKAGVHL